MSEYIVNLEGDLGMALAVACAGSGFAREEIVRCRDCRYTGGEVDRGYFKGSCFCSMGDRYVAADGFCAWGERRGNEQTV